MTLRPEDVDCGLNLARGWKCTRGLHLSGEPCALVPKWWNLRGLLWTVRNG